MLLGRGKSLYCASVERSLYRDPMRLWRYVKDQGSPTLSTISIADSSSVMMLDWNDVTNVFER